MAALHMQREVLLAVDGVPAWWKDLFDRSNSASIFLSPEWVESWLYTYGQSFNVECISWTHGAKTVAGCLLCRRRSSVGPFQVNLVALNTAAEEGSDTPFAEYNDILCDHGYEDDVIRSLIKFLSEIKWDQFVLSGISRTSTGARLVVAGLNVNWHCDTKSSPYVDLRQVRALGYDSMLSSNTRSQIRRSVKEYRRRGEIRIEVAATIDRAFAYLDQLAALHRETWFSRGKKGAFSTERFMQFHRNFIERTWSRKQAELIRVSAGDHDIAFIYNFIYRTKVYFYQSGLAYENVSTIRPGLVAHYFVIQHYASEQFVEYDFLAGDARYKQSLASNERHLSWFIAERSNSKMSLISLLRYVRNYIQNKRAFS